MGVLSFFVRVCHLGSACFQSQRQPTRIRFGLKRREMIWWLLQSQSRDCALWCLAIVRLLQMVRAPENAAEFALRRVSSEGLQEILVALWVLFRFVSGL